MPTDEIYTQLKGLAERLGGGELLKISKTTATLDHRGRIIHMGFEAIVQHLGQVPVEYLAGLLKDGQILKIGWDLPYLVCWGKVLARSYSEIAVRLNRRA